MDAYPPFASLPSSPSAIRVLDFLSDYGQPLDFYVDWLEERYPRASTERVDWMPHDASVHELGTGKSRVERLVELRRKIERVPKLSVVDGINATKLELPRMWFNKATASRPCGDTAPSHYRRQNRSTTTMADSKGSHYVGGP